MPIDKSILEQYVVTANSGKYSTWDEINSKFPELKEYDPKVLEEYVVTANSGKYGTWDEINSKFPEFFTEKKKPSQDFPTLQDAFGVSLRGPQIPKSSRLISTSPSTGKPSPNLPSGAKQGKQTLTGEKTSIANKLNTYQATLGQVSQRYKANRQAAMKAEQMGDIETAKEIYPLIEKDRQAIGTLTELIKNGREIARTQEPDTFLNNADIGFNTALGTLLQAPEGATAASAAIVKDVLDNLDVPKKEVLKRTIDFMSKDANVSHYIGEVGRLLTKSSEDRTETIKSGRDYNGSAWTALKKGDIGKAANYGFKDFANSLPSSMAYMSGIGAAAMSAGTVADELGGMEDRGEEVTALKTYGAIVKSALEVATERMLGAGKAGKELVENLGKPAAEKAVKEATEALVKKSLGRKFAEQYGEEVLGEEANTIGSNAVDIYINGDKNKGLFDGIGDTFLQALIGSTVQGGPATVINHRIDSKRIAEANAMKEQAVKLTEQAMEQPTEAAAQALEEKALELNKQAEDILTEERDMALNLSQETLDYLNMYDQQVEELLAAKEGVDAETAAIFDEKIEALEKEREQAVEVAKKEAKQNAKEEAKLAKEAEQEDADMLRAAKVEEGSAKEGEYVGVKASNPTETDKSYQEAQQVNTIVSKENPNASVLIQPKGEDLSLTAVYVGKDKRGNGIGSKVLETIKREADKLGKKVILDATNELDEDTDLVRLGKFYEKNGFKKVGENKYEYDPKAKDSSGDIGSSPNVGGAKESDITAGTNKTQPSENVGVQTQEELVETPAKEAVKAQENVSLTDKGKESENPALKDVESTAKALDRIGSGEIENSSELNSLIYKIESNIPYTIRKTFNKDNELISISDNTKTYLPKSKRGKELMDMIIDPLTGNSPKKRMYRGISSGNAWAEFDLRDKTRSEYVSEAYHKAKQDGSNPELVKAVEELLTPKENAIQEQEASSVPIQPKAEGSQEVQGTQPESGPKEVADKGEKEKVEEISKSVSTSPKNIRDLYTTNRTLFGLNRVQSFASAVAMDRMVGVMAKRAGISKSDMYGKLKFEKASEENLPKGVKLQVDAWHGSPYQFDKFTTEKIGTGEGAQAFGWGLYFTDLESIARNYAEKLSDYDVLYEGKKLNLSNKAIDDIAYELDMYDKGIFKGGRPSMDTFLNGIANNSRYWSSIWDELEGKDINKLEVKKSRNLYKVSIHKGKTPDQYTWLEWDKELDRPLMVKILSAIAKSKNEDFDVDKFNSSLRYRTDAYDKYGIRMDEDGKGVYFRLSKALGGDKQASLFLLDNGIDGIKYPAESISRGATTDTARGFNYVVFDENAVSIEEVIKFQKDANKARGAVMVTLDGQAVIYALTDPNVSTPLHELAHVFEHYLTDAEKAIVQNWAKTKGWNIETSEAFARGFEKYLSEGKSPIPALQKIFEKFKDWLTDIYNGIVGSDIDIELNDSMREIYSQMLGKEIKPSKKEVLIPKEFKPSVESKKAAKAFVELSNSEGSAPSIKERKQAKIQEAIEEVRKSDPAKADKMQEVFDRMPEIQQTLLEKGIIKAIDCKWG